MRSFGRKISPSPSSRLINIVGFIQLSVLVMLFLPFTVRVLLAIFPSLDYHWVGCAYGKVHVGSLLCLLYRGDALVLWALPDTPLCPVGAGALDACRFCFGSLFWHGCGSRWGALLLLVSVCLALLVVGLNFPCLSIIRRDLTWLCPCLVQLEQVRLLWQFPPWFGWRRAVGYAC